MSKTIIVIGLLSVALLISAGIIIYNFINQKEIKQNAVLENIQTRKSVRHFIKDKKVSQEQIEKILKAGMAAPSARNAQPWEFIVINDREILNSLAQKYPFGKMLADASCAITVAGRQKTPNEFWVQDTSAVTENMLLAMESMGLGAVWIGIYPVEERVSILSQALSLPPDVLPLNIVAIGYPTGEDLPKDKWKPEKIHYNKY